MVTIAEASAATRVSSAAVSSVEYRCISLHRATRSARAAGVGTSVGLGIKKQQRLGYTRRGSENGAGTGGLDATATVMIVREHGVTCITRHALSFASVVPNGMRRWHCSFTFSGVRR